MKVIVYVGLPKTATTFYQLKLFPYLKSTIIYNPNDIMERISYFLNLETIDNINKDEVNSFHKLIAQYQKKFPNKNLFIVNEHLGFGYNGVHPDSLRGSFLTKTLFKDAHIIISLRYQTDWLLSSYMHHIDIGGSESIEKFLNYEKKSFIQDNKLEYYDNYGNLIRRLDTYSILWDEYIKVFLDKYPRENIHVLFFENFKKNKEKYTSEILKILGWIGDPPKINYSNVTNKGRSAFTCNLTSYKSKIFNLLRISVRSIVKWNDIYSKLKLESQKKKKNKIIIFYYYFKIFAAIIRYAPWQFFIKRIDNIIYLNWDMLAKHNMREKLDIYYKQQNQKMLNYLDKDLIPKEYIE